MIENATSEYISSQKWYKIWAGNWSFLSLTHFADQYTETLDFEGIKFAKNCALIYHDGACSGFMPEEEKDFFSKYIANIYTENPSKIDSLIKNFREQADSILAWVADQKGTKFNSQKYEELWKRIDSYYVFHIINKWMVEALDPVLLEKHLPNLQEARLHAEPVFKRTEELMNIIAEQISNETKKSVELVLSITKKEILGYWNGEKLPNDDILKQRRKYSAILQLQSVREICVGDDAVNIEKMMATKVEAGLIKGTTAYPGKVKGVVKIILDPTKADHFNEGDILVTGMTRPEYLALMQKAGAFVTDSGGILSHAAIVARELKKPCVIGTQVATKVLKDGDIIEVDAEAGVVRIIK